MTSTKKNAASAKRLASITPAEIDAMTDEGAAKLMGATPTEIAAERAAGREWTWKAALRVVSHEPAARVITDPAKIDTYRQAASDEIARRGRPRLGTGESVQIRARLDGSMASALNDYEARTGRPRSEIVRAALAAFLQENSDR